MEENEVRMKGSGRYRLRMLSAIILALCVLAGCGAETVSELTAESGGGTGAEYTSYADLSGKTVSMLTGAPFEELVRSNAPDVGEFTYFNNTPDMLLALEAGKTDAVLINNAIAELAVNRDPGLALFPQNLQDGVFGLAFQKDDPARDQWQAAYDTISEEEKQALWEKWTGSDESAKTLPEQDWPGKNGTVQAAVCDTLEPMSYAGAGGTLIGFDVEMILRMAKELDVHVEFTGMEFSAILSSVQSGKATIGAGSIIVTDERREAVDFVEYYPAAFVLIVRSGQARNEARWQDYNGKRLGVLVGPLMEDAAAKYFPDSEYLLLNSYPDCIAALLAGKIDAYLGDEPGLKSTHAENPQIDYIHDNITENNYAFAFRKDDPESAALCAELNEFLARCWADGTMEELDDIWLGVDESRKAVDMSDLTGENGTIHVATTSTDMPWSYIKDGKNVGYDIDLVVRFCRDRGYALELGDMDFAGRIPAVQSGKYDFTTDMNVTPEREEQVLFSEPTSHGGIVLAVLASDLTASDVGNGADENLGGVTGKRIWSSVKDSFQKTFLREDRWKLFLQGIGTTLLITVLSILFGTLLGFLVFMLCRNGNPVANTITRFCVWLVRGMPVVVLLMILYYIIFGNVAIPGTAVAVIGFTLVFAAGVYGIIKSGVGAIDKGQLEAAYALGYTNRRAFYRVILPQAMPHFMPAYKSSITEIIKATAIVGYVAVQDLTKMGDIVRSRTYEAFFPLIAVAIIYFILAAVLTFIVNRIELRIDPKQRKPEDIRKEVEGL